MLTRMEEVRAQVAERDELIEIIAIALLTRKNVFITQRTRTESCELSVRVTLPPKASRRESPDLPHSPSRLDLSLKSDYTNNKYRT